MYAYINPLFFLNGMKKDLIDCVAIILECQLVKVEHRHPTRLLKLHEILESKWEAISMESIVGLPMIPQIHESMFGNS